MTHISPRAVFFLILASAVVVAHAYIWHRTSNYLQLPSGQKHVAGFVFAALALLMLSAFTVGRMLPREAAGIFMWLAYPWMGIFLLLVTAFLITDIAWLLTNFAASTPYLNASRRDFLAKSFGFAALGTTGLSSVISFWNALSPVEVKPVSVTLERLPKALDGLRIAQISDLHISPMGNAEWVRKIVERVNELSPDIIAITGDLADGSVAELASYVDVIADLEAPLGVYFVTGNHDYYSGVESWCRHVSQIGIHVLRNERVALTASGETFDLAGVEDYASGNGSLPQALQGRDETRPLILLAHQPIEVENASRHGVDLLLSGHTHGGQIWPFSTLVYLQQPYVKGLHRHKDTGTQIYISSGTGYWGPPMRLGTTAEITQITLRAAAQA